MQSPQKYIAKHHRPIGIVVSIIALVIAAVYFVVVPEAVASASGIAKPILLYSHSACWLLIASASGLWAARGPNRWSGRLLYTALAVYIIFLASMLIS